MSQEPPDQQPTTEGISFHALGPGGALESEDRADGSRHDRRTRHRSKREARRTRRRARPWWRRAVPTWRMLVGGLLGLLLLGFAAFVTLYLIVPVPDANAHAKAQTNVYYYADGTTELARTGSVNREDVPIDQIPVDTQHAAVSAEDRTFYQNKGVDLKGMARAAWNSATGKGLQGGSTITQQYVKNYYLTQDQTYVRKVKELFIALKVDQQETKDEILAGYLNTSYFGRNAYGIQTAANAYYGVDVSRLTLAQGAYLAALLQAPSAYDVKAPSATAGTPTNRDKAVARWNYVLDGMVSLGFLDAATRASLTFPEPIDPQPTKGLSGQAGYLVDIADDYLASTGVLDAATLKAGGWKITTTFDKSKQDAFVAAVKDELTSELDPGSRPDSDTDVRVSGASIEPGTGKILAVYGGPDYAVQPFNDALRQDNQVGSTFKPIDLAAGIEGERTTRDGRPITTQTVYDGTSRRAVVGGPTAYAPPNEDDINYGPITLRYAMMKSVNSVYAQEGVDAGLAEVRQTAVRLGIPDSVPGMDPANTSMTLGTATPSALNLAAVYAALANHGQAYAPWAVLKLEKPGAEDIPGLPGHPARSALGRGTADAVTDVLQDVVSPNGTGARALGLGRPAAGKTGTTDNNRSAWFAGYTPELATAVGLFRENPRTHAKESLAGTAGFSRINGGAFPTAIWTAYMRSALSGSAVQRFDLEPSRGNTRPTEPPSPAASPTPTPSSSTAPTPSPVPSPSSSPTPSPTPSTTPSESTGTTAPQSPEASGTPSPGAAAGSSP
ncbi:transglycosylase domain-containing protein [Kitasatospora atroaurantiaca]|uniref:Membrane peptidoglycan carboxypeptidase n=1 Tax=Kitasatospora atroaurantiaca TaxID=285545 RepID=A0A561EPE4_9ACTN|nr:transglycosylase domain-containing protein [Kitasatospora atroaurantiaca]TWE17487.1 membrane peptidoglycan carboxypeptidase [Kitasatospora atroaurantiaca]